MQRSRPYAPTLSSLFAAILLLAVGAPAAAQDGMLEREGYLSPPEPIADALFAPWHRNVRLERLGPADRFFVVEEEERRMPPLSLLGKTHYHIGGFQVDPAANRSRRLTTRSADGLRLVDRRDGDDVAIRTPDGARVSTARWSPDGRRLAYLAHFADATHIYVADPESGRSDRLTDRPVLATLTSGFDWAADGRAIFAVLVPEDRGPEPREPAVPTTPRVDMTTDEENILRTYPDLLETPHDRALVEYYGTGQLARIDVESGDVRDIGEPALLDRIDASPDGEYVRVRTLQKPLSKIVPVYRNARLEQVWDLDGTALAELDRQPVRDGSDDDDDDDGDDDDADRRSITWRPDGRGLGFLRQEPEADDDEASGDEEDSEDSPSRKDRVMQWLPPFDSSSLHVVWESDDRIRDIEYSDDARTLYITRRSGGEERIEAVALDEDTVYTIAAHDPDDEYDDPGDLVTKSGARGEPVVRTSSDSRSVYLEGTVYHEDPLQDAPQPFLDRVEVRTGETTRLFESSPDRYERVAAVADDDARRIVISRESSTEVRNYFAVDVEGGAERQLTQNRDYSPDITNARRETFMTTRADGLEFKVEITLPADYREGEALPAIFWHYPREYEDVEDYHESLMRYNKNSFPSTSVRSMEKLVRLGYAVADPDIPIIGEPREWNDYYPAHLRNSFSAAIDALAARGWIDRDRLAVGGHSYGGFGTINALVQTPFFKAGIAGSANSNRSLTPGGFQRERRTLWQARETYVRMSPLFWMNQMNGALLLYHGLDDQNVGTFPDHSIRSFHAANVLGKTAALYMYPYEAHGPRAEESILDLWARWTAWLDTHVKNAGEPVETVAEDAATDEGTER